MDEANVSDDKQGLEKETVSRSSGVAIVALVLAAIAAVASSGALYLSIDAKNKANNVLRNYQRGLRNVSAQISSQVSSVSDTVDAHWDRFNEFKDSYYDVISKYRNSWSAGEFSIPTGGLASINGSFACLDVDAKEHLTGYKITGYVLNKTSIIHSRLEFKLYTVNAGGDYGSGIPFTINDSIAPAKARSFEVYVPDIDANDLKLVKIIYQKSFMSYSYYE